MCCRLSIWKGPVVSINRYASDDDIGERNDEEDGVLMELRTLYRCLGASQLTEGQEESRHNRERHGVKTDVFA